jgi:cytochrome c-type biogenesis protein CcmH/NrfF
MKEPTVLPALLLLVALPLAATAQEAPGDDHDHDHDHDASFDTRDYSRVDLARFERLYGIVVCNCPREDWTKSLTGCPDPCANHQKAEIRQRVTAGWTDEQILGEQERKYGPKAIGRTSALGVTGFLLYAGPFLLLIALVVGVVVVLSRITRPRSAAGAADQVAAPAAASDDDARWSARIDRELEEMD